MDQYLWGLKRRLIDEFNAAGISVPPNHAAMHRRFEAIQREIESESGCVMRI
jgi:hypothetical protein